VNWMQVTVPMVLLGSAAAPSLFSGTIKHYFLREASFGT
jgi:hypothetical protein